MIWGGGLTGSAVGIGIPGFFMEYKGALRGKYLDIPWDFTIGGGGRFKWGKTEGRHTPSEVHQHGTLHNKTKTTLPLPGSMVLLHDKKAVTGSDDVTEKGTYLLRW